MANDQRDQGFDKNRPGQERNQGGQNPGMKRDDLNKPSESGRGLNPQGERSGSEPYGRTSGSTGMSDKDRDLNAPSSKDRGVNPSGTYTPGRDIDREGPSEPYARERGSGTFAQGEPRREEPQKKEEDDDLTEIPSREEERKIKTPSGEKENEGKGKGPSSETGDYTDPKNPQAGKPGSKGDSSWGAE